ncbi:MAG TPA: helix-turn-helix transcriptional regulator [Solirubrobacteraceae bacterium]|nr:helix-turn-helix transcriptional regulator [Solirubrobacteraceae bacterium]
MTDIGPLLREARMHAGLDISEVEDRTKIRAKYLRALENEEWALLPGTAFTKGFLRSYATLLGLDARMLVDEYKRQWEDQYDLESQVRPLIGSDLHGEGWSRGRARRWAALLATIVVLAVAFVLVGHLFGSPSPSKPAAAGSTGAGATPSGQGTTSATGPGDCAASARGCVSLRIEPRAALYACLVGDGRVRIDGARLEPGAGGPTYHAHRFVLTLGSHRAALVLDGRHVALPAGSGALRLAITRHGRHALGVPAHRDCVA